LDVIHLTHFSKQYCFVEFGQTKIKMTIFAFSQNTLQIFTEILAASENVPTYLCKRVGKVFKLFNLLHLTIILLKGTFKRNVKCSEIVA
jgi:hypothetical protein